MQVTLEFASCIIGSQGFLSSLRWIRCRGLPYSSSSIEVGLLGYAWTCPKATCTTFRKARNGTSIYKSCLNLFLISKCTVFWVKKTSPKNATWIQVVHHFIPYSPWEDSYHLPKSKLSWFISRHLIHRPRFPTPGGTVLGRLWSDQGWGYEMWEIYSWKLSRIKFIYVYIPKNYNTYMCIHIYTYMITYNISITLNVYVISEYVYMYIYVWYIYICLWSLLKRCSPLLEVLEICWEIFWGRHRSAKSLWGNSKLSCILGSSKWLR